MFKKTTQNPPDIPSQPKTNNKKTQREQGSKMLAVRKQQNMNTGTAPKVVNSGLCFLYCMSLLLKCVSVGLWRLFVGL